MSDEEYVLEAIDESPKRFFVDSHDILSDLTEEEIEEGLRLGREGDDLPRTSSTTAAQAAAVLRDSLMDHGAGKVVSPFSGQTGGVSIELQVGRGPSSDPWHAKTYVASLNHHTASATISSSRMTPALSVCKNGRTDLQGPLCNGYGGGDFVYRIITLGWANHPGLGGPATFAGVTVPQDNGRPYLWGTEWDWDGTSTWPDAYKEWMARCNAGILDWLGRPADSQGEHKDPWAPARKIDRNQITRSESIVRTRTVWGTTVPEGFPLTYTPAQESELLTRIRHIDTMLSANLAALLSVPDLVAQLGIEESKRDAAILGAIAAAPTAGWSDAEKAEFAADIASRVDSLSVEQVLDALAARLVS